MYFYRRNGWNGEPKNTFRTISIENDRACIDSDPHQKRWRPRTAPNHFTPFSLFNSHFESPPSTIFHGKQYRFRYLPNNSESFSSVSSYERGEERRGKKRRAGRGKKRSGRKREREEKRKNEGKVYQTRRTKKERQIFTQPWLEIPWSLSYTLFNAIEFPLPSLPKPLPPSSRAASLSVGLECTAVTAYTATRSRLLRRVSLPLLANLCG